jgi:hypothetical protein
MTPASCRLMLQVSTLISHLMTTVNVSPEYLRLAEQLGEPWLGDYLEGTEKELYFAPLPEAFDLAPFYDVRAAVIINGHMSTLEPAGIINGY